MIALDARKPSPSGYRYYSAQLGRWTGRDPIGEDGGANVFASFGNCPICGHDALGMSPRWLDAYLASGPAVGTLASGGTIVGPIAANITISAYFFPETCQFGLFASESGFIAEIEGDSWDETDRSQLRRYAAGLGDGSLAVEVVAALPIGGGRHGPESMQGWSHTLQLAVGYLSGSGFVSDSWYGLSGGLSALGQGGGYMSMYTILLDNPDNPSEPLGKCPCLAMRLAARLVPDKAGAAAGAWGAGQVVLHHTLLGEIVKEML